MKNLSKIFLLLIIISYINGNSDSKSETNNNEEKLINDEVITYYAKLIANHILETSFQISDKCGHFKSYLNCLNYTKLSLKRLQDSIEDFKIDIVTLIKKFKNETNDEEPKISILKYFMTNLPKEIKIKEGDYGLNGKYGPYGDYGFEGPYLPKGPFVNYLIEIENKIESNENLKKEIIGRRLNEAFIPIYNICKFLFSLFGKEKYCKRE